MSGRSKRKLLFAVGLICALAVSCADERTCDPEWCRWPACVSTPEQVLVLFAKACMARDLDACAKYLDETYVFEFAEDDWDSVGVTADAPYWVREADLEAMDSLFTSPAIVTLHFTWNLPISEYTGADSAQFVFEPDIQLTVTQEGTEPVTFWAYGYRSAVTFKRSAADPCWTITKMREMSLPPGLLRERMKRSPAAAMATEPTSWGRMKWMAVKGRFKP